MKRLEEQVKNFFLQFKQKNFAKGEILIYPGSKPQGVFYLSKGSVKQYTITEKGHIIILNMFKQGTYFPMSNAVNENINDYYFEAETKSEVWLAPVDKTLELIKSNPEVLYDLLQRVYKGTDGILLRMCYLISGRAYYRLIIELLIQAKRFGQNTTGAMYVLNATESELAAYSGLTRETVSREMKSLREKNLVTIEQKNFIIHDLNQLKNELIS